MEIIDEKESMARLLEILQPVAEEHEIIKTIEEFTTIED